MEISYVPGYFSLEKTKLLGPQHSYRAPTLPDLGIVQQQYSLSDDAERLKHSTQWQRLVEHLRMLNQKPDGPKYKVIFASRHGEGWHNVKDKEVGRQAWSQYWSRLEGDSKLVWVDAHLTPKGIQQAEAAHLFWKLAQVEHKVPYPESFYTSPLTRCLQTALHTYGQNPRAESFRPVVKEFLRGPFGVQTCDRRGNVSTIVKDFPRYEIEETLTENDELWMPDRRETLEEATARLKMFLQDLFLNDDSTYISLVMHSGAVRALEAAIGHPDVMPAAGSVLPFLIQAVSRDQTPLNTGNGTL